MVSPVIFDSSVVLGFKSLCELAECSSQRMEVYPGVGALVRFVSERAIVKFCPLASTGYHLSVDFDSEADFFC